MPDIAASTRPTLRFAVIGNPIAHSLSPSIHQQFAAQFEQPLRYHKISCSRAGFTATVNDFFASGGHGLNVTAPFKLLAGKLAGDCGSSVNTLASTPQIASQSKPQLRGRSTDGIGLVNDLRSQFGDLQGARTLLLGAGGAAQAVVAELLQHGAQVAVLNRSPEAAVDMVQQHGEAGLIEHDAEHGYQLVINAASLGGALLLHGLVERDEIDLSGVQLCYDLSYGQQSEPLQTFAASQNYAFVAGLGMLIEQAAASYHYWTGDRPDTSLIKLP